ncbi:MMPL family transporter [Demequina sp. NBRC 110056]|uniref:MMPL family transporter n=1 Tax=Demequina sp. NBRC 110056 TaxID=1570345 RepID=UPI0009FC6758|nr:MMPL family transporter [Demequina sp. NBRC 110056]
MAHLLYRLGRASSLRPLVVVLIWALVLASAGGAFVAFGGKLTDSFSIPGLETERVTDELAEEIPGLDGGTGRVVLTTESGDAFTEDQQAEISAALAELPGSNEVENVIDPFEQQAQLEEQAAQMESAPQQIEDGKAQLEAGQAELDAGLAELQAGQDQLDAARGQLDEGQARLDAAIRQAQDAGQYEAAQAQFDAQQAELDASAAQLDEQQAQIDAGLAEIEAGQDELDAGSEELLAQEEQLELGAQLAENASILRTVSDDGATALAAVQFGLPVFEVPQPDKDAIMEELRAAVPDGVEVNFSADFNTTVEGILGVGEVVGVLLAFAVLLIMMRAILPALQPIVTSVIGVGVGVATALAFSGTVDMQSVTPVLGVMLALAVGIDYSLFIVNRHRTQLARGMNLNESIGLANGTSGNAVVFAGATVIVALLALNVTGIPFLGVMGTVAAFCVLVAVAAAVTLTPALLGWMGDRALSKKARANKGAAEHHEPEAKPMRTGRAVLSALVAAAALAVIAIPSFSMRLGLPDGTQEPEDSTQYIAYTTIDEEFGEGLNGTLLVTARLPEAVAEEDVLAAQVALENVIMETESVAGVAPAGVSEDRDYFAFQVIPTEGPSSESTEQLVHDLRDLSPLDEASSVDGITIEGTTIGVAGEASGNIDLSEKLDETLPLYLAVVVGLSVIILIIVFRSILVPLVATAGFVLSLFAAFGAVTAVYQWGWLGSIFGVHSPGPILSFLPIMLTGILFGLAMDYQLFITTGMREAYVHGNSARASVTIGLRHGRAVVTAAAIIMASVFGGFVFSHISMIRPMGFGLAAGVLLDAFVVRMVIIPSIMHLLGEGAWWLPKWLDRILPNVDVEGSALEREHPVPDAEDASEEDAPEAETVREEDAKA